MTKMWIRPDWVAAQVRRHPSHTGYYAFCPLPKCDARVTGTNRMGVESALTSHLVMDHDGLVVAP